MMNSADVIQVKNLHKAYGDNKVLKGVSFSVKQGTMLALLGPNGAGKTTTVRILSTLLNPDKGQVIIKDHDLAQDPDGIRSVIGLTGQSAAVDELLTGEENLVMMGRLYRLTKASAKARAQELLQEFDLVDAAKRKASTYSGGMRRRLDLAVSLIASPPIIFLDEPTTGLDPRSRLVMWDIIRGLMDKGTTILLTTQYLEEADQLADDIILIDGGKVIAQGTPKSLKSKIGKDKLVLTFVDLTTLELAKSTLGKKVSDFDNDTIQLSVPIKGSGSDVGAILANLADAKVTIKSMDIHKPTLDDVFLSLTHKPKPNTDKENI